MTARPSDHDAHGEACGALAAGLLASAFSTAVLAWRGRTECGSAAAPLNAVSHWVRGDAALRADGFSLRDTLLGTAVHTVSSLFRGGVYTAGRRPRCAPTAANAATDALLIALASVAVDLAVVPERLSPGSERRLSRRSLALACGSGAVGLALASAGARRRARGTGAGATRPAAASVAPSVDGRAQRAGRGAAP